MSNTVHVCTKLMMHNMLCVMRVVHTCTTLLIAMHNISPALARSSDQFDRQKDFPIQGFPSWGVQE